MRARLCTCASGFFGDKCKGFCSVGPRVGGGAGSEQTGVFEEELCYPTGIWNSALEEAAVMMDHCNYQN